MKTILALLLASIASAALGQTTITNTRTYWRCESAQCYVKVLMHDEFGHPERHCVQFNQGETLRHTATGKRSAHGSIAVLKVHGGTWMTKRHVHHDAAVLGLYSRSTHADEEGKPCVSGDRTGRWFFGGSLESYRYTRRSVENESKHEYTSKRTPKGKICKIEASSSMQEDMGLRNCPHILPP